MEIPSNRTMSRKRPPCFNRVYRNSFSTTKIGNFNNKKYAKLRSILLSFFEDHLTVNRKGLFIQFIMIIINENNYKSYYKTQVSL